MSHFTTIQTEIKDIEALRAACHEMGFLLVEDTAARGYGSNSRHGEYVIRLKGPYDIALNREKEGNYGLTTDWWDGHVAREVGEEYGRLLQLYGVHKAIREARKRGLTFKREAQADGTIKLNLGGK